MTMTTKKKKSVNNNKQSLAQPFASSRQQREQQIYRTKSLYSAATACSASSLPIQWKDTINGKKGEEQWWQIRPLTSREIQTLEGNKCRCRCNDWSKVILLYRHQFGVANNNTEARDWSNILEDMISDSILDGYVVLGVSSANNNSSKKAGGGKIEGIHKNGMIYNCILEPDCALYDNTVLSHAHVHSNASILNCGVLSFNDNNKEEKKWVDKISITLGAESGGGRPAKVQVESTLIDVCRELQMSSSPTVSTTTSTAITIPMNIISSESYIRSTPTLQCIYLSSYSSIDSAASVSHSILLPHSSISNSSTVSRSFLQWNSSISSSSFVEESLLMEHAHVGPSSSIISNAILGPDVHVSAGEVHASLLGPNTNAHHQSLLIGLLWPLGRGNVGYGSNIGSNHTGRLPDQENVVGEGTFWGLSCIIKYPVDLTYSPYSIVAAGVALDPQRITMPFSLFLSSGEGGRNQIVPGWVLQSSPYTIVRSETKFQQRRKAKRHAFYTGWKIIRPSVVNMCFVARQNLLQKKRIDGIGNNDLSERSRLMGIRAYTDMIQRYALHGLLDQIKNLAGSTNVETKISSWLSKELLASADNGKTTEKNVLLDLSSVSWPVLPWEEKEVQNEDELWNHQKSMLLKELPLLLSRDTNEKGKTAGSILKLLLSKLVQLELNFSGRVYKSKHRDDVRGKSTVPGYEKYHVGASDDPVVIAVQKEAKQVEKDVVDILGMFSMSLEEHNDDSKRKTMSRL